MILSQSLKQHLGTDGIHGRLTHGTNLLSETQHPALSGGSNQAGKTVGLKDGKVRVKPNWMTIHVL